MRTPDGFHARSQRGGNRNAAADFDSLPSPTGGKTLNVLELVARHPRGISSAQAARLSGITPNLVFRILKTLAMLGYCHQHAGTKTYTLSGRLLELAGPQAGEQSLVVAAHAALKRLRDAAGETVQLVIESGGKTLVLEQVRGAQALQVCGQVGMRAPLYSSAPGKAILAWWPDERRRAWLDATTLKRFTPTTLADRASLEQDLAAARRLGFTIDRAEGLEGIHCVAAPILDVHGAVLAAVTIMAPVSRLPEDRFPAVGGQCVATAREIEIMLQA
ncbi:IclR family transcriptional regulator [bacterium]|nr:IclR family transcriptional regulator [bacterium]